MSEAQQARIAIQRGLPRSKLPRDGTTHVRSYRLCRQAFSRISVHRCEARQGGKRRIAWRVRVDTEKPRTDHVEVARSTRVRLAEELTTSMSEAEVLLSLQILWAPVVGTKHGELSGIPGSTEDCRPGPLLPLSRLAAHRA